MPLEVGQLVEEKYRVVRSIGEGGMGAVYEGENVRIRRRVAIKTLHAHIAKNQQVVTRFEHEAQAAGRIGSDHILEVLDIGALPGGERFIVMEFLDGESLARRIERLGRMTAADLFPIMSQVLEGLAAAHAAGIVHRDLKPENVYILRQKAGIVDFVKIIDFGISKFHNEQQGSAAMTMAGAIMGTPLYMSPEQANGSAEADARSDIYSLGVIMYEALSGRTPFSSQNLNELLFKIVLSDIPRVDTLVPGIEPAVAAIVGKATSKKREDRFSSAQEMRAAIENVRRTLLPATSGTSWRPPPPTAVSARTPMGTTPLGMTPPTVLTPHAIPGGTPDPTLRYTPGPQAGQTPWPIVPSASGQPGVRTNGAWGPPSQRPPGKSAARLAIGISFGALLALGGGGFVVFHAMSKAPAAAGTASIAPPARTVDPTPPPSVDPQPTVALQALDPLPTASTTPDTSSSAPPPSATSAGAAKVAAAARPVPKAAPPPATPARPKPKKVDWGY